MYQSRHSGCESERLGRRRPDLYYPSPIGEIPTDPGEGRWETRLSRVPDEHKATDCYITNACLEVRGQVHADSCYELRLLRLFRTEYIAKLPDGEEVMGDYGKKAPAITRAIEAEKNVRRVYLELYEHYLGPTLALILNGRWDDAYEVYRAMCQDMENRYLKGAGLPRADVREDGEDAHVNLP